MVATVVALNIGKAFADKTWISQWIPLFFVFELLLLLLLLFIIIIIIIIIINFF